MRERSGTISTPLRSWIWRSAGLVLALAIVATLIVWFSGRRIWTDGQATVLPGDDPHLRDVAWLAPKPLGPELSADDDQVYEPSLSPDGTEFYFVRGKAGCAPAQAHMYASYRRNNAWTKPAPLDAVNSPYDDLGPRLTADGKFLIFYSNRPGGFGGYDLWASARNGDGWGKPFNLGPGVNSEFNEYSPDPTPDGRHLIFSTNRTAARREQARGWNATIRQSGGGDYDLWIAELDPTASAATTQPAAESPAAAHPFAAGGLANQSTTDANGPAKPQAVNSGILSGATANAPATQPDSPRLAFHNAHEIPGVNSPFVEGASCMSPAGDFLYFASNRPGGYGKFDLYRARVHTHGNAWEFAAPENLGPRINSADNELDPFLSAGGFHLVFSTDRFGDKTRYALAQSESRELYAQNLSRPLPHFGSSGWLMLLSLAVLLPLIFFLRGFHGRHLNLLAKCLIVSLLIHAVITFLLTFVVVTQQVTKYVRAQTSKEVTVALSTPKDVDVALSIRQQFSDEIPTPAAAPAPLKQVAVALEPAPAQPIAADVNVPRTRTAVAVALPTPAAPHAAPAAPPVPPAAPPRLPELEPVAVKIAAPRAIRSADELPPPRVDVAGPPLARTAPRDDAAVARAQAINLPAVPTHTAPQMPALPPAPQPVIMPQSIAPAIKPAPAEPAAAPLLAGPRASAAHVSVAEILPKPDGDRTPNAPRQVDEPAPHAVTTAAPAVPAAKSGLADAALGVPHPTPAVALTPLAPATPNIEPHAASFAPTIAANPSRQHASEAAPPKIADAAPTASGPRDIHAAAGVPLAINSNTPRASATAANMGQASIGLPSLDQRALNALRSAASPTTAPADVLPPDAPIAVSLPHSSAAPSPQAEPAAASSTEIARMSARHDGGSAPTEPVAITTASAAPTTAPFTDGAMLAVHMQRPVELVAVAIPAASPAENLAGDITPTLASPHAQAPAAKAGGAPDGIAGGEMAITAARTDAPDAGTASGAAATITATVPASKGNSAATPDALGATPIVPHISTAIAATAAAGTGNATAAGLVPAAPQLDDALLSHLARAPVAGSAPSAPAAALAEAPASAGQHRAVAMDIVHAQLVGSDLVPAAAPAIPASSAGNTDGAVTAAKPKTIDVAPVPMEPLLSAAPIPGALGPGRFTAPDSPFMRAPEQRKPLLEKLGGTKESEDSVSLGLAYLARVQEADGHWNVFRDQPAAASAPTVHDSACTGLATLAFLAHDHSPAKPGPYQQVLTKSLDYLLAQQSADGDLRGSRAPNKRGAGGANMYDQAIATLALAEAALMTHDQRYVRGASLGAQFIVDAQDPKSGGWRYSPGETGDTSVFGWQILALHSAAQLGFAIPQQTRDAALRYVDRASLGKLKMLGCYKPGDGNPTATMTAELLFSRILLGGKFSDEQIHEATEFLTTHDPGDHNLYYFYYSSLCMVQLQDPAWKQWNIRTRDSLIHDQARDAASNGSWPTTFRYGDRGGRVFTTAMATLTLEVYYRYLPMEKRE